MTQKLKLFVTFETVIFQLPRNSVQDGGSAAFKTMIYTDDSDAFEIVFTFSPSWREVAHCMHTALK